MHVLSNTKGPTGVHYSPKFYYEIKIVVYKNI